VKNPGPKMSATDAVTHVSDASLRKLIGYHMKRAFNVVQVDLVQTLKPFDLRMLTYTTLVLIKDNPGLRQSQLADAMDIERPNLVKIIDELEGRSLIIRDRVPNDRRAYALKPTPQGEILCNKAIKSVEQHEDQLLAGLDESTRSSLITALQLIQKSEPNRTP